MDARYFNPAEHGWNLGLDPTAGALGHPVMPIFEKKNNHQKRNNDDSGKEINTKKYDAPRKLMQVLVHGFQIPTEDIFFGEFLFLILKVLFVSNLEDTRPPAGGVILERLLGMLSALKAGSPTASFIFGYQRARVFYSLCENADSSFPVCVRENRYHRVTDFTTARMEKEIVRFICLCFGNNRPFIRGCIFRIPLLSVPLGRGWHGYHSTRNPLTPVVSAWVSLCCAHLRPVRRPLYPNHGSGGGGPGPGHCSSLSDGEGGKRGRKSKICSDCTSVAPISPRDWFSFEGLLANPQGDGSD